ncbi:MAG: decaprenyl-phosphate phosphoribosyltransferase [Endomicrobiales bacterium]
MQREDRPGKPHHFRRYRRRGDLMLAAVFESLRPKQWTKNLFIFAGILFSQNFLDPAMLLPVVSAFFLFCLLSGSVYLVNDITDLPQDRNHPRKSKRPLASGRLSPAAAAAAAGALIVSSLIASSFLGLPFFLAAAGYLTLQLAYSFFLKHIVILDVFSIAAGFVLRVVAGALVIDVEISSWLIICTILLALFLGLSKRRHEIEMLMEGAQSHRKVLEDYSSYLLDQMIGVVTASTVVSYALYTTAPETVEKFGTKNLMFTIPFVLYGIFRYLYLIHKKGEGGSPENILVSDIPLLVDIFLWAAAAGIILYL